VHAVGASFRFRPDGPHGEVSALMTPREKILHSFSRLNVLIWVLVVILAGMQILFPGSGQLRSILNAMLVFLIILFSIPHLIIWISSPLFDLKHKIALAISLLGLFWIILVVTVQGFHINHISQPFAYATMILFGWIVYLLTRADKYAAHRWYVCLVVGFTTISSAIAIHQFLVRTYFGENGELHGSQYRLEYIFSNPNQFAGLLAAILPLGVGIILDRAGPFRSLRRIVGGGAVIVLLVALLLTFSRGALFSFLTGGALLGYIFAWARKYRAGIVFGTAILLLVVTSTLLVAVEVYHDYFHRRLPVRAVQDIQLYSTFEECMPLNKVLFIHYDFNEDAVLDCRDLVIAANLAETEKSSRLNSKSPEKVIQRDHRLLRRFSLAYFLEDRSIRTRLLSLVSSGYIWYDHPLFGIGIGNYAQHATDYMFIVPRNTGRLNAAAESRRQNGKVVSNLYLIHAHCLPAQLLLEQGLIGFLFWFVACGAFVWGVYRGARRSGVHPAAQGWYFCLAWSIMSVILHNLVDITIIYHPLKYIFPFIVAIFIATASVGYSDTGASPSKTED